MSTPSPGGPRARGLLRLYRELWFFARGQRAWLVAAIALLFASQLVKLGVPYLAGRAINTLQLQGIPALADAGLWLLLVFLATLASWMLHGPGRLLERNIALTVRTRVTAVLVDKTLALPLGWHESNHSAATVHRLEQSSRALYDFAQSQFIYLQNAVKLVGPVAALWLIEPWVGAAALFGLAAISLSITGFDHAMMRLAHDENGAERRYAATLIDAMGNVTTVFALRQTRAVAALIARRLQEVYAPLKRMILVNEAKWCTVDLLAQALSCSLLALYAWLAARGLGAHAPVAAQTTPSPTLALGNIYMVWEYALQAGGVISAVAAHFQTFARQQADYASGDAIREAQAEAVDPAAGAAGGAVTDATSATNAASARPRPPAGVPGHGAATAVVAADGWHRLAVSGLEFRYGDGDAGLHALAFSLQRGRRYALVGGSGSGKSTLLRVLAGLALPREVMLAADDGAAITAPGRAARWLRGASTLIPQDAEVFEGSLAENLALCETQQGAPDPARYAPALALACVDDFLDLAAPLDQVRIGERGSNWSGGQRQRVALARGVLAAEGSPMLLLDEPTASLDPRTERRVHDRLFAAFPEACIVSSVHRLHLLERFDEVLVMHEGRLVDHGPVKALMARSPALQALVAAQGSQAP